MSKTPTINKLNLLKEEAGLKIGNALTELDINSVYKEYLGKKGEISLFLKNIKNLPEEEKPYAGKLANDLKQEIQESIQSKIKELKEKGDDETPIDITLEGRKLKRGSLHPISQVMEEIIIFFSRLGFEVLEGPEIESDYYNFEALNFPKNHPARDMQDTFYISENLVLRTHTSPMQIRAMANRKPPIRVIAPGKVYRCDSDITHTPMFHQIEGLMIDENITFSDLKGILTLLVRKIFDKDIKLRFRPSFFPFTEPSAEVDIECVKCKGKGCRICSNSGWLEILGSGMVHPNVLKNVNYDTSKYQGFAFGVGAERIAMLKYDIDDIRKFYYNDIKFLNNF